MARVIVTVMHESEEFAVQKSRLTTERQGDGLIVGTADDATITELEKAGLTVERLPDADVLAARGFAAHTGLEAFTGPLPPAPVTVLLACNGPIDPAWLAELDALGGKDVSRAGGDQLRVRIDDDAVLAKTASLPWVVGVLALPPEVRAQPAAEAPPLFGTPLPPDPSPPAWDVRLTRPGQAADIVTWAQGKGFEVVGQGTRRVRLRIPPGREHELDETMLSYEAFTPPGLHNDLARTGVGIGPVGARAFVGAAEVALTGQGEIVGVADSGLDDQHPDFANRIERLIARGRPGHTNDPHGHGTHVSGTILGDGSASAGAFAGVAPGARLVFQALMDAAGRLGGLPLELGELFQEAWDAGVRIHNNSWGSPVQSRYTGTSEDVDAFVHEHPTMLAVFSAGNEGSTAIDPNMPARLEPGRVQPISLGAPATSKNALVVGACRSARQTGGLSTKTYALAFGSRFAVAGGPADVAAETVSGNPDQLAGFSSRGPCIPARRIKPDVVAPGTDIVSARSSLAPNGNFWGLFDATYGYMGGTSMAAPVVTGFAALIREYYRVHRGVTEPSAALLKATIINGTRQLTGGDADGPIPNPHQGFGAVNLATTLPGPTTRLAFRDVPAAKGFRQVLFRHRYEFRTTGPGELRICMAFTDPPGPALVNDLDLVVEPPGVGAKKILGNAALRDKLIASDAENNVEIARIANAPAGAWTVGILCRNLLPGPPQGYALVVLGNLANDEFDHIMPPP